MNNCPTIEIFPETKTHFLTSDGRVLLDIDEATDISLGQQLQKQDVLLTSEPIDDLGFSVPNTPRNFFYLKSIFDPATDKTNLNYYTVRISTGSHTHFYNAMFGVSKNRERIELRVTYLNNWIDLLKSTKLSSLDELPLIDYTKENIENNWTNESMYVDGDDGYYFPIVFYGAWRSVTTPSVYASNGKIPILFVEDLRPHLHVTALLQKMFKKIGWCIDAPFYDTEFGRRLIAYLWRSDYSNSPERLASRIFSAENTTLVFNQEPNPPTYLENWVEFFDAGNNFDAAAGQIVRPFEGKVIITLSAGEQPLGLDFDLGLTVKQQSILFNDPSEVFREEFVLLPQQTKRFEFPVNLLQGEFISMSIYRPNNNEMPYDLHVSMSNEVTRAIYAKGDVIDVSKEFEEDLTCWDLFHALQHLINGIVDADISRKTIRLLTPFNADIHGEEIEGYFNNTLVDLISSQPINTAVSILQNVDQLRNILLGFAKSTDEVLKNKKKADGSELFAKIVDLGEVYKRGTEEDRNPLFEGTALDNVTLFGRTSAGINVPYIRQMPVMVDNDKGEVSYDIRPRILYTPGEGYLGDSANEYAWEVLGINTMDWRNLVAFAFNDHNDQLFNGGVLSEKLIYGESVNDLWRMVYARFYLQYKGRIKIDFLSYLNHHRYFGLDLKNKFLIEYDGHPVTGRVLEQNDYKPCKSISTQMILLPEVSSSICFNGEPPTVVNCDNNPSIVVQQVDDCYSFSIDGTFDCVVTSITWEKKIGAGAWEDAGSGTTIELCDIDEIFQVRATVNYDCEECPSSIIVKTINPCGSNASCNIVVYNNELGQICLQWSWDGEILGEYELEVTINGDELIDPYLFCGADPDTLYDFVATFTFANGCEPLVIYCSVNTSGAICNNNPILNCVPVTVDGATCFTFSLSGSQTSTPIVFFVSWECSNGTSGQWMPGDPPVCCSGTITAIAWVNYCDCPAVCTPEIQCDPGGCTVVNPGTPIQFIACN